MTKISRKLRHLVLLPLCALFFCIGVITAHAATYYVQSTGDDSNPGTVSQPFQSIARGVSSLNAGDTLYIRSGTYTTQIDVSAKTGTPGNYITIAGYPGETVTIRPGGNPFSNGSLYKFNNDYFIIENLVFDGVNAGNGSYWSVGNGAHDIIIRGNEIKNWKGNGLFVSYSPSTNNICNNVSVINNRIHDQISVTGELGTRWYGIYFHSCSGTNLIEGNEIYNNPGGGINAYPGPITNLTIRGNWIYHNQTLATQSLAGLLLQGAAATPIANAVISNNLIYENGTPTSGFARGIWLGGGVTGTKIWNNTVYGNKNAGIEIGISTDVYTVVQNNISYGNGGAAISNAGSGTIQDHNITTNPVFVNAAAFQFNLQTNSPAIDAGVTLSQVPIDIRKNPRPQGAAHDIGAYEVGTGSADPPPDPPQGLRVN